MQIRDLVGRTFLFSPPLIPPDAAVLVQTSANPAKYGPIHSLRSSSCTGVGPPGQCVLPLVYLGY